MSAQDDNPWQWRGGELAQVDGPRHWLSITYGIERVRHLEELAWRTRSSGLLRQSPVAPSFLPARYLRSIHRGSKLFGPWAGRPVSTELFLRKLVRSLAVP